ncbi:acyl-CoA ligase (AMP-forming), exosortase A system-associated [Kangiella sediminilitoris]|uniref:Acyl-CoA ligase (AMP-forming), exosortase system type 1 associated n=1 Tax=Kangiella sediminilitoris TaxID=1144748 RepID=A0A1B3B7Q6_9GAMM|nr:acyl-CoA ligase (AMP-forming), exosortase A system-associated [Kangiella sediminilitoris]AOE48818.1 Acyl-CoA ligase (AMP-forming), exosortase system type 1 associated [Kangiella sediminilitoris]
MLCQFDDIVSISSQAFIDKLAVDDNKQQLNYQQLERSISILADRLIALGLAPNSRIGIYLPKQVESVIALFAASRAGLVFVPINPLLKAPQVSYIAQDCNIELIVTSSQRAKILQSIYSECEDLRHLLLVDDSTEFELAHQQAHSWQELMTEADMGHQSRRRILTDLAAILYTSGSTGQPKGVCLSHQNLIAGAQSVSQYLENTSEDTLLAVLPLSFDYGLSQITTALLVGAKVVLMEYLLPRDVIRQVEKHSITGLAAVPPLWVQLSTLEWPQAAKDSLRYITNSGGAMPESTLRQLQQALPNTKPFLMYGLTEAFRSTYLDPAELERRPTSIGKAIPNADILVLRKDGTECGIDEPGELVHRGVHVSLGYWNAPEKTAKRFKPLSIGKYRDETAVWSGDTVKRDKDGFLYFIGRQDDMIKCSGYRISPAEIEDALYGFDGLQEVAAVGVKDKQLGQAILLVVKTASDNKEETVKAIKRYCQQQLPNFMQPKYIEFVDHLPRNPNGKIDRPALHRQYQFLDNEQL